MNFETMFAQQGIYATRVTLGMSAHSVAGQRCNMQRLPAIQGLI